MIDVGRETKIDTSSITGKIYTAMASTAPDSNQAHYPGAGISVYFTGITLPAAHSL